MSKKVNLNTKYAPSEDVVAREVQGEFLIIPITSGIGDMEDNIFTLNETGQAIWKMLDGKESLKKISESLTAEYSGTIEDIEKDVLGLTGELMKRNMLVEVKR